MYAILKISNSNRHSL